MAEALPGRGKLSPISSKEDFATGNVTFQSSNAVSIFSFPSLGIFPGHPAKARSGLETGKFTPRLLNASSFATFSAEFHSVSSFIFTFPSYFDS